MRGKTRFIGLLAIMAVVAAACGDGGGDQTGAQGTGATGAGEGVLSCQVTDQGGIDDKSFNQTAFSGLERARDELGVEIDFLESQTQADYAPNIQAFLDRGCDIIVTVGFLLGDDTQAAAEANPDQPFAIIDFAYDPEIENVLGFIYETDQAAFMAGYVAASFTTTGTIGTYGGINIGCGVTCFMDGFFAGAMYYNQENGTDVEVLGWDPEAEDGLFTGDFENQDNGRRVTEDLIAEGADVILPVAGPVGLGTAAAVEDSPEDDVVIWVDTDGCVSAEEFCSIFLTSVLKNVGVSSFTATESVVNGDFAGGTSVGTLENGSVDIAPFHEFEDQVSDEVKADLEVIREGIISGEISVKGIDYI